MLHEIDLNGDDTQEGMIPKYREGREMDGGVSFKKQNDI
jgi:hypothetical protein